MIKVIKSFQNHSQTEYDVSENKSLANDLVEVNSVPGVMEGSSIQYKMTM